MLNPCEEAANPLTGASTEAVVIAAAAAAESRRNFRLVAILFFAQFECTDQLRSEGMFGDSYLVQDKKLLRRAIAGRQGRSNYYPDRMNSIGCWSATSGAATFSSSGDATLYTSACWTDIAWRG